MQNVHLSIIGGGIMGTAITKCLIDKKILVPSQITVSERSEEKSQFINQEYGVHAITDNEIAIQEASIIILAIKPQDMEDLFEQIKVNLKENKIVISIAAGIDLNYLKTGLNHKKLVRVMPNMPAQIGAGISVWTSTEDLDEKELNQVRMILKAMGNEVYVNDEDKIDLATAISGSGPAYYFALSEYLIKTAIENGFEPAVAENLVRTTALGAAKIMDHSNLSTKELRENVTSKGGTTEAAFKVFDEHGFSTIVDQAVMRAYERARELSQ